MNMCDRIVESQSKLWATGLTIGAITGDFSNVGKSILAGALTGGIASGITSVAGSLGNNVAFSALSNVGANAATSTIMGDGINLAGVASSTVGNFAASKVMGEFNAVRGSWLKNVARETVHTGISGAISGGVSAVSYNAIKGRPLLDNFGKSAAFGAIGGASSAVWKSALIGAPTLAPKGSQVDVQEKVGILGKVQGHSSLPLFRTGGLARALGVRGFAGLGRDIIVNESAVGDPTMKGGVELVLANIRKNRELWVHEAQHYYQYKNLGFGRALDQLAYEQIINSVIPILWGGFIHLDVYEREIYLEWEAEFLSSQFRY